MKEMNRDGQRTTQRMSHYTGRKTSTIHRKTGAA